MADEKKLEALRAAMGTITREFGEGSIMQMDPEQIRSRVQAVPTGSIVLDEALGIGGLPSGRVVEIYGPESSGKTTFCYEVMAQVQAAGGICAFIDTEHAMDPEYAGNVGVNVADLVVSQPDNGEQALSIAEKLIESGAVALVVIDSVAALTPKAELEGEMTDSSVGVQARLMSKACRKLVSLTPKHNCTVIFTNQLREKIGVMFGSPETTPGGRALKFYASVRLDIRRIETLKEGTDAIGNRVRIKVVKNKVAPPFRQAEFTIRFGEGFDTFGMLLDVASDPKRGYGLVSKSGAFYTLPDGSRHQGAAKARAYLTENPEAAAELDAAVRERMFALPAAVEAPTATPEPALATA
ncbi:recombinase RecA [Miltoncostaea oceani]|uniref:recombinase RecA n=1 Tax=Miltoncostaea oceani TaxID=2843216 RepID=UPI002484829F|nr:recombinase RecA [Miltoncostaea oceani]